MLGSVPTRGGWGICFPPGAPAQWGGGGWGICFPPGAPAQWGEGGGGGWLFSLNLLLAAGGVGSFWGLRRQTPGIVREHGNCSTEPNAQM
jgi:hypothetical protein